MTAILNRMPLPVVLGEGQGEIPLGLHLDLLEDKEGSWTLEDVMSFKFDDIFVASEQKVPFFPSSKSVYWARLKINMQVEDGRDWLIWIARSMPSRLYIPTVKSGYLQTDTDPLAPFSERKIKNPDFVFDLPKTLDHSKYVYIRVEPSFLGYVSIEIKILSEKDFSQNYSSYLLIQGIYYGFIIVMVFYNLFIYFAVRESSYFYYVVYTAMFGPFMFSMDGLSFQYLWPDMPYWNLFAFAIMMSLSVSFSIRFFQMFLGTKAHTPSLHKVCNIVVLLWLTSIPITIIYIQIVMALFPLLGLATIAISVSVFRSRIKQGSRAAKLLTIAFSFLIAGDFVFALSGLGVLPLNGFTTYGLQIGSAMEVVFLSLALADRINTMNKRLTTQAVTLENNAVELKEHGEQLEEKVEIRTGELSEANSELSKKNEQIHDSLRYSVTMQHSLIPDKNILKQSFQDHFVIWEPRDVVSGDIYFCFPTQTGCLLAVIDCTGHGVPGAFMTMIAGSGFQSILNETYLGNPAGMLTALNQFVTSTLRQTSDDSKSDNGMDMGLCCINTEDKKITYAGAKFSLLMLDEKGLNEIKGDRRSVGYKQTEKSTGEFTNHTIKISQNTAYYLHSDGIVDQSGGAKGFGFGNKRFKKLLIDNHQKPFSEQKEIIVQALYEYQGNNSRRDDVTVVGFSV